jgi:para-nitrobenzyl esterase
MQVAGGLQAMIEVAEVEGGKVTAASSDRGVSVFPSIPYAAPPTGAARWRPPAPVVSWTGSRSVVAMPPAAPQFPATLSGAYSGLPIYVQDVGPQSEDCLYLNVWTGAETNSERRPVLVWFHWGGFMMGSAAARTGNGSLLLDGRALADQGLVVVTVNYRLGRFGFLAHPWLSAESENGASGNYGIMDQIAALKWVRDNIAQFGGDPQNVTIAGISAGSASTSLHMSSPRAKGLFHRAIAGSGGFFSPVTDNSGVFDRLLDLSTAEERGLKFSAAAGVASLDEMRALSVEAVMGASVQPEPGPWSLGNVDIRVGDGLSDTSYPIVDGFVVPEAPREIFEKGLHNDVPLLTGSPLTDGSGLPSINTLADFQNYLASEYGALAGECSAVYPAATDSEAQIESGNLLADRVFGWQNWMWAKLSQQRGKKPVYYYDWIHAPFFDPKKHLKQEQGAVHGVEIPYIFNNLSSLDWRWTDGDRQLASIMSAYVVNFAKAGDPNGLDLPYWPQFDAEAPEALSISIAPSKAKPVRQERFRFHDRVWA